MRNGESGQSGLCHLAADGGAEALVGGWYWRGFGGSGCREPGDGMTDRVRGEVIDGFVRLGVTAVQRTKAGRGHSCHWVVSLANFVHRRHYCPNTDANTIKLIAEELMVYVSKPIWVCPNELCRGLVRRF